MLLAVLSNKITCNFCNYNSVANLNSVNYQNMCKLVKMRATICTLTLSVSMSQALNILFGHRNLSILYLRKTTGTIIYITKIPSYICL